MKGIGIKDPPVHCGPSFQFSCSSTHFLGTQEDSLADRLTNGLEESAGIQSDLNKVMKTAENSGFDF